MNTYEKKYKDALEKAKSMIDDLRKGEDILAVSNLETMFPELAESEDERIRKELLESFKYQQRESRTDKEWLNGIKLSEVVAWLEKQAEKKSADDIQKPTDIKIHQGDKNNPYDMSFEEAQNYITKRDFDICLNDCAIYVDDRYITQTIANVLRWADDNPKQRDNKIEPKFKVGDYIRHNKANIICKVISVNSSSYYVENVETGGRIKLFNAEQNFHLWTIQDAKDGDVLAFKDNSYILLVKEVHNTIYGMRVSCYCHVLMGKFETAEYQIRVDGLYPATKEQRDLLFQEICKAGYEWDEKKKELKKIEWNDIVRDAIFDEDIDIPFGACDSDLYYQEINIPDGFQATIEDRKIILKKEE